MYKSEMILKLKKWIIHETCKYDIFLFLHYSKIFYYVYFGENDDYDRTLPCFTEICLCNS